MACRYTYKGKTYEVSEFDDLLRAMPPSEASKFMPTVQFVPDAPMIGRTDAWVALALKRVIKMAVDGGYDKVAFVNGEQSAERYDLSKQIDAIDYRRVTVGPGNEIDLHLIKGGDIVKTVAVTTDTLEDHVGKDMAKKIMAGEGVERPGRNGGSAMTRLAGLDLKVGGEGMKAFYDQIVPQVARDVLKKVGGGGMGTVDVQQRTIAKIGSRWGILEDDGDISNRTTDVAKLKRLASSPQPGFDITDAMREKAGGGMPMFSEQADDQAQESSQAGRARDSYLIGRDDLGRPTFGLGSKAYRKVADIANAVLVKVAMKPISKELGRAMRMMKLEVEKAQKTAAGVAEKLKDIPAAEREMISDVIEQELKAGVNPPAQVLAMASSMSAIMSQQADEMVRLGMLSQDTADHWRGRYLPRFYESKIGDAAAAGGKAWNAVVKMMTGKPSAMRGIGGKSSKRRGITRAIDAGELQTYLGLGWTHANDKFDPAVDQRTTVHRDFTKAEREDMGEIRDSMFRFVMGYMRSQKDIALGRLYERLAADVGVKGTVGPDGYVQVPTTMIEDTKVKTYGRLSGMWVPAEVMHHLSANSRSEYDDLLSIYRKGLAMWKEGKVVLNPVSHANNVLSNITSSHFAGVSYWDSHKYVGALRDLVKKSPMVTEGEEAGLFGGTFTHEELMTNMPEQLKVLAGMAESKTEKAVNHVWNALSFWLRKPAGIAYEAEDSFFRYLLYRDARKQGLDPQEAAEHAQRYIFTYDDLPMGAKLVRDTALPFFSYAYKAVPMLAHTALNYPWRYAAPAAAIYTINALAYAIAAGEDDDDWQASIKRYLTDEEFRNKARAQQKQEEAALPEWMKGSGLAVGVPKTVRLGMDELTNLPVFLDIARIIPGGDMLDMNNNSGGLPIPAPLMPSNPLLTTAFAMLGNKDMFFGKDIVDKNDTTAEAAEKRGAWLWSQFAPAVAVNQGHWTRAMNVLSNVSGKEITWWPNDATGVGRDGLPVQPGYAAMQTFGIKARPVDLDVSESISRSQKEQLIKDMQAEIRRTRRLEGKGALSSGQAEKVIETQRTKIDRLRDGLDVNGNEKD